MPAYLGCTTFIIIYPYFQIQSPFFFWRPTSTTFSQANIGPRGILWVEAGQPWSNGGVEQIPMSFSESEDIRNELVFEPQIEGANIHPMYVNMHIISINILQAQNSLQLAGYSRFYFIFYLHRFSATNTIEEPLFMTPTCFHGYEIRVCWFEHGQFFHGVSALGDLFKLCMHHMPNLMRYSTKA